jgi:hypothetical protein
VKDITTEIRQTVGEARSTLADPKPLHALAGAGDLLVERVRLAAGAQRDKLQSIRFDPSTMPAFMIATRDNARGAISGFQGRARDMLGGTIVKANDVYDDLAKRGASRVGPISRERASQDLAELFENAVRAARGRTTSKPSTRKAGSTTKSASARPRKTATTAKA